MRAVPRFALAAAILVSCALTMQPRPARALPMYAARQGFTCQTCHFDPNGGGPRNDFGFAFAKNRHTLEPDTSVAWRDLELTNRVGEHMPVYFGVDQRFMLLANAAAKSDSLDRLGFFNMENAIYIAFQPHPRLTLVYSRDGFDSGSETQDAWGMIGGLPAGGYVKAGRFRTPFGLRMDDHTVATRNSFLDFESQQPFLPYDPRHPDMGIELGASAGGFFGRTAFTNGASSVFSVQQPFAEALTAKLGYNHPRGQVAVSVYDDYLKENKDNPSFLRRTTRWDMYALSHWWRLAVIGDLAAGTDRASNATRNNLLAGFAEIDYAMTRAVNWRVRFDYFQGDRDTREFMRPDSSLVSRRDLATFRRYAIEGEIVPVPFAELRWTLRLIDPVAAADLDGLPLHSERQAYLQFHFSY
jgi:hypothetical protein